MSQFEELLKQTDAPLCFELSRYLERIPVLGTVLRHPLVFSVPYSPVTNALLNKSLEHKKEALNESLAQKDFARAIFLHERPYRFQALLQYAKRMEDKTYWELLGDAWTDSEAPSVNKRLWLTQFLSERKDRQFLMAEEEQEAFAQLPEQLTIYRGSRAKYARSISWTTDLEKAEWFAKRREGREVFKATYPKAEVLGYFTRRDESEVIVNPKYLKFV